MLFRLKHGKKPPRVMARAHVHRKVHETVRLDEYETEAFITPSWQFKTEYAYKVNTLENVADVGGVVIRVEKGRILEAFFDCYQYSDTPEIHV